VGNDQLVVSTVEQPNDFVARGWYVPEVCTYEISINLECAQYTKIALGVSGGIF